jgi:hypothetical protein
LSAVVRSAAAAAAAACCLLLPAHVLGAGAPCCWLAGLQGEQGKGTTPNCCCCCCFCCLLLLGAAK